VLVDVLIAVGEFTPPKVDALLLLKFEPTNAAAVQRFG
jgi:hypothetical protein